MRTLSLLTDEDHRTALRLAREAGINQNLDQSRLNAPINDAVEEWFRRIWDQIEASVRDASHGARERAGALKEEAIELWNKAQAELGRRSSELRSKLFAAVETYLDSVINSALNRVRPSIEVGGTTLKVIGVKVEQAVNISVSLKSALDDLIALASEGKLVISAEYGQSNTVKPSATS